MDLSLDLIVSLLSSTLRISIPIAFAALGAIFCERSGIVNIGLEGMMLGGAFAGVWGSYLTGSAFVGLLFAMLAGALLGLIHAVLTIQFKTDHIISGLGINLLSLGLTTVLMEDIWGNRGRSGMVNGLGNVKIPGLIDIPVIGPIFGNTTILFYLLIVCMVVSWIVLYKTVFGLRVRVIGDNPKVADSLGINVYMMQYIGVIVCGILAGLGGAYLSIGDINMFSRDMVAGRGYIALAALIFGGWNPFGVFGASLLFGFAQALQIRLQVVNIPVQFVEMLPYLATILVLIFYRNRSRGPLAVGKHFRRGEA